MTWHNFSIFDVQVGRWCGRMWWLSGEQLLKGSWESQKFSSAVSVWADKMESGPCGLKGRAARPPDSGESRDRVRSRCCSGLRTQRRKEGSSSRAPEGGMSLRAHSWGSTESRLPWPGALKYHRARFTKSNNGPFEWHFKTQTFYFL